MRTGEAQLVHFFDDAECRVHIRCEPAQNDSVQSSVAVNAEHILVRKGLLQDLLHIRSVNRFKFNELDDGSQIGRHVGVCSRPNELRNLGAQLCQLDNSKQPILIADADAVILQHLLNEAEEVGRRYIIDASE